jgi:hypothetical protein
MQTILVFSKALRPKIDNVGITMKADSSNEEAFREHICQFIADDRASLRDGTNQREDGSG